MSKVRITEEQARILFGQRPGDEAARSESAAPARPRKKREDLPENQVESQITDFLRAHGWTVERQQAGTVCGIGQLLAAIDRGQPITKDMIFRNIIHAGTKGRCDWVATRAGHHPNAGFGVVQRIEIEVKAPGKKPDPEQFAYMRMRKAMGFVAEWFDRALPSDLGNTDAFVTWYQREIGS